MSDQNASKKYILVETVTTFRHRYVIELDHDSPQEWALDSVVMNNTQEFSQKYLDETIISHRELPDLNTVVALAKSDNPDWCDAPDEDIVSTFVTPQDFKQPGNPTKNPVVR